MTCQELLGLLDGDGDLVSREVEEHLVSCPRCAREVARWRAVRDELAAMGDEATPPFLHTRIMAHLREAEVNRGWMRRVAWRPVVLASLVVVALVVVVGGLRRWQRAGSVATAVRPVVQVAERGGDKVGSGAKGDLPALAVGKESNGTGEPARDVAEPLVATPVPRAKKGRAKGAPVTVVPEVAPRVGSGGPAGDREAEMAVPMADEPRPAEERALPQEAAAPSRPEQLALFRAAAVREAPMAESKAAAAGVVCAIRSLAGKEGGSVSLPSAGAPPTEGSWSVHVAPDGEVTIDLGAAEVEESVAATVRERLRALRLPPGDYRLERSPEPPVQPR